MLWIFLSILSALKYCDIQGLNEQLKLIGGTMNIFSKKLLSHEIFSSMVLWSTKYFFEKLVKPSSPLLLLNVHFRISVSYRLSHSFKVANSKKSRCSWNLDQIFLLQNDFCWWGILKRMLNKTIFWKIGSCKAELEVNFVHTMKFR